VADLAAAIAFHERVWGRPPDMQPNEREVCWQVADDGWLRLIEDPERAGRSLLTLIVGDLDELVVDMAGRGIVPDESETIPGKTRKAVLVDPDGNRITLGQPAWT
jgi:predicted enzyme related to lactoylglutathione lyase